MILRGSETFVDYLPRAASGFFTDAWIENTRTIYFG